MSNTIGLARPDSRTFVNPNVSRNQIFEPPVFHFPRGNGSIILAIDAQKPWEDVGSYGERIVELFAMKRMSVRHDSRIMCRVFLGGVRAAILHDILEMVPGPMVRQMEFNQVVSYAKFLEASANELNLVDGAGVKAATLETMHEHRQRTRPSMSQDGLVINGEINDMMDGLYQIGPERSLLRILYRR